LFEVVVASHHFTGLIFAPLLLLATFIVVIVKREIKSKTDLFIRLLLFIGVGLSLSLLIVYPVLFGAVTQNVNIPHPTTMNYFQNFVLFKLFFINMYGFILLLIPLTAIIIRYRKDLLPVLILALFLLILGLGGTTPLPQIVFGENWLGLTLERFNLFSVLTFAPLLGFVCIYIKKKKIGKTFLVVFFVLSILFSSWVTNDAILRDRPQKVPVESLVTFLNSDQHWMWRYLTLGFDSSDFCKLTIYSNATTLDGWYYRGRNITELSNSGIGYMGGAKFDNTTGVLRSILENASQYHLRFVFCNDRFYEPMLNETGFTPLDIKYEQVTIWVKYDSTPLEITQIVNTNHKPTLVDYSWGIIPITYLIGLLLINSFRVIKKRQEVLGSIKGI
jgi:hypothetical protein